MRKLRMMQSNTLTLEEGCNKYLDNCRARNSTFPSKVFAMDSMREIALKKFEGVKNEAENEYLYNFLTYGAYRVVCVWINKENREPAGVLAKMILELISR